MPKIIPELRDKLLLAARKRLVQDESHDFSTRQLAADCGIAAGTVFNYFPTKESLLACIRDRAARGERPPWGTFLGGEIYIHAGGSAENWTAGCIALDAGDMESLFPLCGEGTEIVIYQGE